MCDVDETELTTRNRSSVDFTILVRRLRHCKMQEEVLISFIPIIILIGTISNVLCILVFRRKKLRNQSIGFYLIAYAVINLMNLYLSYGMSWLSLVADMTHFENYTDWGCRIWEFVYRIVAYSGIWILVSALVDRYISICHPSIAERMCQVFMAKIALVLVFTGICVISVHAMWSYELMRGTCVPIQEDLLSVIWRWMSASCYVFIPLFTLLLLNLATTIEMCSLSRRRTSRVPTDLTYTVLVLSSVYLLLAVPATVVNIIDNSISVRHYDNDTLMYNLGIGRFISDLLSCLNPVIMFFICVLFSKTFRAEFLVGLFKIFGVKGQQGLIITTELSNGRHRTQLCIEESSDETLL
ncbi:G-protein coupled receptor 183 [Mizuhopecten yessoensis]|uniref:G-protein coupled receptor 183 n=1 Tax=Mizuhopecten yessoensis TaxID=6573 RepID=A0A210QHD5_MIZYE|nr:G-protein coupled receptor 183 [Mizuhopecten yessoensis]